MVSIKTKTADIEVRALDTGIVRIRAASGGAFRESLMNRYCILRDGAETDTVLSESADSCEIKAGHITVTVDKNTGRVTVAGAKAPLEFCFDDTAGRGFDMSVSLDETERLFGLGDESRESIARRNTTARMDVKNVVSYGPVPYVMSSNGWGMLVNCTYAHTYDLGKTESDKIKVSSPKGNPDIYLFIPESHKLTDILELYTRISGKAPVMPKFAYGYTFVLNEQTNAREMLWDCKSFRREGIPCDMVGLEPQWMSVCYDTSVDKKWDEDRFYIPQWFDDHYSGDWSFFYNLREMGFKLSLWLCNDYDLVFEEERQVDERAKTEKLYTYSYEGASILDPHFEHPRYQDQLTKKDEAWFEHLKKFVDNGASAFKLDAAFQVNDHPDRLWGGKFFDDEVHNVYPTIYVKQMQEGFTKHTDGRRAFIYTSCFYAGSQRYAASWAGDTGGGYDTVVAMLNYGLSGHTNVTCDMEVTRKEGIHYGFLSPWVQQLGWRNWQQPWFLREELEDMIRYYARLRSALFPYIYSMAHKASRTALPLARALTLMYPDVPEYDYVTNTYMLGDSLLVAVFDMHVTLPEGEWYDYWTGEKYTGGRVVEYEIPEGRGGALFVRAGSVIAEMEPQDYIEKVEPDNYILSVYPGADTEFVLVEDDGYTYDYAEGKCAETSVRIENSEDSGFDLLIAMRTGEYFGRPKREGDAYKESDPEIHGMKEPTSFTAAIKNTCAKSVTLGGEKVDISFDGEDTVFTVPAELHRKSDLRYKIEL